MSGFGPLAQLDLDHFDLVACGLLGKLIGVEGAVIGAAPEISRPDFVDQIAPPLAAASPPC
jgi:hypothetical protein